MKDKLILAGALSGLLGAARADYEAFKSWKSAKDALTYDWSIAFWRWFQGGIIGAVTVAGLFEVAA
jgi:hypothetical protein